MRILPVAVEASSDPRSDAWPRLHPATGMGFQDMFRQIQGGAESPKTLPALQPSPAPVIPAPPTLESVSTSHVVKRGESLWGIIKGAFQAQGHKAQSREIEAAIRQVAKASGLKNPNVLSVGQRLDMTALTPAVEAPSMAAADMAAVKTVVEAKAGEVGKDGSAGKLASVVVRAPMAESKDATADKIASIVLKRAEADAPEDAPSAGAAAAVATLTGRGGPSPKEVPAARIRPVETSRTPATLTASSTVDITALMQRLLDGGPAAVEAPAPNSPWKKLLGGAARLTSGYGIRPDPFTGTPQFHQGIDLAAKTGTKIYPYMSGVVKYAGWDNGNGKVVVVKHANGLETMYGHTSQTLVKEGDVVTTDTPIAHVGSTGHSTGPHLHFEMKKNDRAMDPIPQITGGAVNVAKVL